MKAKYLRPKNYDVKRRNFKPDTALVLDETVFLHDPLAFTSFKECQVFIFDHTIFRLREAGKDSFEKGRRARRAILLLDSLRAEGSLKSGVTINKYGGKLRVLKSQVDPFAPRKIRDQAMFDLISRLKETLKIPVVLLTNDPTRRVSAQLSGISSCSYPITFISSFLHNASSNSLSGEVLEATIEKESLKELLNDRKISIEKLKMPPVAGKLSANQYIQVRYPEKPKDAYFVKYNVETDYVHLSSGISSFTERRIFGLQPKNVQQLCALDYLCSPSIEIVIVSGRAGTGKSLLSFAAGLEQTLVRNEYSKLAVIHSGQIEESTSEYFKTMIKRPLADFVECMIEDRELKNKYKISEAEAYIDRLLAEKKLVIEFLNFLRGRTFQERYVIVDEAQNLSPSDVRLILTRAGEGTKFVFCGDPSQADNPNDPEVNEQNNGLKYLIERCRYDSFSAHIDLKKCERSKLADRVTKLMW